MEPIFSIITPVFNAEEYIEETARSVLNQSFTDFEYILIDDCSRDSSLTLLNELRKKDKRVNVIALEKNSGPAVARNKGIEKAAGRYIAFIDSDDLWDKEFLKKSLHFIQKNNALLVCAGCKRLVVEEGRYLKEFVPPFKASYKSLLKTNSIACLTAVYDSHALGKEYMEDCRPEDYTLWLKLLKKTGFVYGNPEVLATYNIRSTGRASYGHGFLKKAGDQFRIYSRVEKMNFFRSCYYTLCWALNGIKKYYL